MKRDPAFVRAGLVVLAWLAGLALCAPAAARGDAKHGEYLAKIAGCRGCHTEAKAGATPFAGGRALRTPFGTFYGPNITPDSNAGIGGWSEADFRRSLRDGVRADGAHLFPAFPYPSFTLITDSDVRDLWAYLRTLPPSPRPNRPHDLRFPFGLRFLVGFWNMLYLERGPFVADPARSARLNRGAYLVNAVGHCGECHTPRNWLGAPQRDRYLAGAKLADGASPANLTPARLGKWSDAELSDFLKFGITPSGDAVGETMDEEIRNSTSQLTADDLAAVIAYLHSVPSLPSRAR